MILLGAAPTINSANCTLHVPAGFNTADAVRITNTGTDTLIVTNVRSTEQSREYVLAGMQMVYFSPNVSSQVTISGLTTTPTQVSAAVLTEWSTDGHSDFPGTYPVILAAAGGGGGSSNVVVTNTPLPVDGSGVTQPVSATALPLPTGAATAANQTNGSQETQIVGTVPLPTGAATAAKQPAIGTAGTPSADVLTVQGSASGTSLPVTVTGGATSANQTNGTQKSQLVDPTSGSGANVLVSGTAQSTGDALLTAGTVIDQAFSVNGTSSVVDAGNYAWVSVQVTGTPGSCVFEMSNDNVNWASCILAFSTGSTQSANNGASAGLWAGPLQARYFRVRGTSGTSAGTIVCSAAGRTTPITYVAEGTAALPVSQSGTWNVGVTGTASVSLASITAGYSFSNITTATTTTVKSGAGVLRAININTAVASGTITIYNNTTATGAKIGTVTLPATLVQDFGYLEYFCAFGTGLTIVTTGAGLDITVSYA